MTQKTIAFKMTDEEVEIMSGVQAFALANGWTPEVRNEEYDPSDEKSEEMIDNPVTPLEYASTKLWGYVSDSIIAYNARLGAEQGRSMAIEQTKQALANTKHELTVE